MWRKIATIASAALMLSMLVTGVVAAQSADDEGPDDLIAHIADRLGLNRTELLEALLEGQSLADVAAAQGVDLPVRGNQRPGMRDHLNPPVDIPQGMMLEILADVLGMTPQDLRAALHEGQRVPDLVAAAGLDPTIIAARIKAEAISQIQAAVDEGKLPSDRAEVLIDRLEASDRIERWLAGEQPPATLEQKLRRAGWEALADSLGMSVEDLQQSLREGQTVADLMDAAGVDPDTVSEKVKTALIECVEQAAQDGEVSAEQGEKLIARIEASTTLDDWLSGQHPQRRPTPRELLNLGRRVYRFFQEHPKLRQAWPWRLWNPRPRPAQP